MLLSAGPTYNIMPAASALLLQGLNAVAPNSYGNLKSHLAGPTSGSSGSADAGSCLGPKLVVDPLNHFRSYVMFFAGGWLKFGGPSK